MISDKEARQYILQQVYEDGYRYLTRDESAFLYAHKEKPRKKQNIWDGLGCVNSCIHIYSFSCFKDIKWVDDEPLDIAKELGIIDWTKVPKDTKVLVWDKPGEIKKKSYFSYYKSYGATFPFMVYCEGATSWTSVNETIGYRYCELFKDDEEEEEHNHD